MTSKILIVDDSMTARRYLRAELERLGYVVSEAADGPTALSMLEAERPALVISDVNMNPMDGLQLVTELRKRFSRAQLPVLMLTTEAGDDMKKLGRSVGATGWLVKPFDRTRMSSVIAHVLHTAQK